MVLLRVRVLVLLVLRVLLRVLVLLLRVLLLRVLLLLLLLHRRWHLWRRQRLRGLGAPRERDQDRLQHDPSS